MVSAISSFYSFFDTISTFLSNWPGPIRSRSTHLHFDIELFQFSKAWRNWRLIVPLGTREVRIHTRSVLVMDEVQLVWKKQDGAKAEKAETIRDNQHSSNCYYNDSDTNINSSYPYLPRYNHLKFLFQIRIVVKSIWFNWNNKIKEKIWRLRTSNSNIVRVNKDILARSIKK